MAAGRYDRLAACVASKLDEIEGHGQPPTLRVDEAQKTARVFKLIDRSDSALYDLYFVQAGANSVKVEGRSMATIHGRGYHLIALWPAVEQCAEVGTAKSGAGAVKSL